jgi:hypothetical protein
VKVIDDPRLQISVADRQAKNDATRALYQIVEKTTKAYDRLKDAEKTIGLVESQWVNVPDSTKKEALKMGSALRDSITVLKEEFFQHKEEKGIKRSSNAVNSKLYNALGYIGGNRGAPNSTTLTSVANATKAAEALIARVDALLDAPWKAYRAKVELVPYSLFR